MNKLPRDVQFNVGYFKREALIYVAEQRGHTILYRMELRPSVLSESDLANRENRDVINAVDAMVFSMAAAALKVVTGEKEEETFEAWTRGLVPICVFCFLESERKSHS